MASLQVISAGGKALGACRLTDWKIEVSLAVHPRDPRRLVAAWIQGVSDAEGKATQTNMWAASTDAGRRWSAPEPVPGLTPCTGNDELTAPTTPTFAEWAADPNVSIGADGVGYLASVHVQPLVPTVCCGHILVNRSRKAGLRWERPAPVDEPLNAGRSDPAFVTADPSRPGRAYLAWNHLQPPSIKFASTSDGGVTWSTPSFATLDSPPGRIFDLAPMLVLPDHSLLLFYADSSLVDVPASEWVLRSTDGGASWSAPVHVADHTYPTYTERPSVAAGRDGRVYLAWADSSTGQVMLVRSDDSGRSFGRARQVERRSGAELATVAVRADGVVGLLWYDRRNDVKENDAWFSYSDDRGGSWRNLHLGGPFAAEPSFGTTMTLDNGPIGGYVSLVATREGFAAAFVMTKPLARTGPSDVFLARIVL